jgi:hypothetical protein
MTRPPRAFLVNRAATLLSGRGARGCSMLYAAGFP